MKKDAMSKKGSTKSNLVSNLRYEPKVLTFNKPIKVIEKVLSCLMCFRSKSN